MGTESPHQPKIMIADDDPEILHNLKMLFETKDFEVVTVDNG